MKPDECRVEDLKRELSNGSSVVATGRVLFKLYFAWPTLGLITCESLGVVTIASLRNLPKDQSDKLTFGPPDAAGNPDPKTVSDFD